MTGPSGVIEEASMLRQSPGFPDDRRGWIVGLRLVFKKNAPIRWIAPDRGVKEWFSGRRVSGLANAGQNEGVRYVNLNQGDQGPISPALL